MTPLVCALINKCFGGPGTGTRISLLCIGGTHQSIMEVTKLSTGKKKVYTTTAEWPISRDAGSDAMWATMRAKHETAMRCDAKILAMRVLAAEILCDALPRCENTSDAMPRCRPLSTTVETLLFCDFPGLRPLWCIRYTLLSGLMVYALFPCFSQENSVHHSFFALWPRGRATDREKRGATVVVYTLFSPAGHRFFNPSTNRIPRSLMCNTWSVFGTLVAPYRAILRYYRCDTPYRAILFQGIQHSPTMMRYPPLGT